MNYTVDNYNHLHINFDNCIIDSPSEPLELAATPLSDGVLLITWSPPCPVGVQLNYTVFLTNTNTSVVRYFTTSNTTITLTRGDVEGDGECDEYVWSVTAVNQAGASRPANHSSPVSFSLGF